MRSSPKAPKIRRLTISRLAVHLALAVAGVCVLMLDSHIDGPVLWVSVALATAYGAQIARSLWAHGRFVRSLHRLSWDGQLGGIPVRFVSGAAPFVAGILRPRVYCDPRLVDHLTPGQQRAVALHELHHQRRRDPLRLQFGGALRPVAAISSTLRAHLETWEARYEVDADRYAIRHGATRSDVAGALAALLAHGGLRFSPGFESTAELRIRALSGEDIAAVATRARWIGRIRLVAAGALVVACIVLP